ncbi:MAG: kinase [Alphaproteobacteria bacterium]
MIISRTPFRISFFGGGTDYPAWFAENGGAVLAATINRYCYITCRFLPPFFEHKSRIVWSHIERVYDNNQITHPVVRVVLEHLGIHQGVEIHHDGDLPSRAGLGSSSAFTVGVLHALHALKGARVSKSELARQAIHVEQSLLKENVGIQDQIQTAHGGLNRIEILSNGSFRVDPIILRPERKAALEERLMMFYTGISRTASEIAAHQIDAIPRKHAELRKMQQLVDEAVELLTSDADLDGFGRLLHETWMLKRGLTDKIAPSFVHDIYDRARRSGALGGKLLGAGGGGFMIFYVPPERHQAILNALPELLQVPIALDNAGSQIILYEPDIYSQTVLSGAQFRRYSENGSLPNK